VSRDDGCPLLRCCTRVAVDVAVRVAVHEHCLVLACVDVHYTEGTAVAGCVLFEAWTDPQPRDELVASLGPVSPYRSGQFYQRELPPLMVVLERVSVPLDVVIVDGYVWLAGAKPGLGARLRVSLGEHVTVVGVAKTEWTGGAAVDEDATSERRAIPVRRGRSARPLFVTAAGIDVGLAAKLVAQMHGAHRIPTLLKRVDALVRKNALITLPGE
jgi:deoxyribonuclease V